MAVLDEERFQVAHPLEQRGNVRTLLGDLGLQFGGAVEWRHASMLHLLHKSA